MNMNKYLPSRYEVFFYSACILLGLLLGRYYHG